LFKIGDAFFLNNAEDTMGSRNGSNIDILGDFCEFVDMLFFIALFFLNCWNQYLCFFIFEGTLCRYMKIGSRLVTVDQLSRFEQNTWRKINSDGSKNNDGELDYWMKEESIRINGGVSWNRGDEKNHIYWLYTKIKNDWTCDACTMINPLLKCSGDDQRLISNDVCFNFDYHSNISQEKRTSKRRKIAPSRKGSDII
jgi:hypothetical protein